MAWRNLAEDLAEELGTGGYSSYKQSAEDVKQSRLLRSLGGKCERCGEVFAYGKTGPRSNYCKPCRSKVKYETALRQATYVLELEKRGIKELLTEAAQSVGVSVDEMFLPGRAAKIVSARRAAWGKLRTLGWSYPDIGRLFGRDHSTVMAVLNGKKR